MATLAFSLAGQVVGGLVGGPFGAPIGRALGALAGSAVDDVLFGDKPAAKAPPEFRLQGSVEGGPIPRLYGWSRLTGNVIWATDLEELDDESSGAKGLFGGSDDSDEPVIAASFALALCEGVVHRLGRIWADGQRLETEGLTVRFYRGTADQGIDSLIEAKQGTDGAPAYRGLCYLVFERLPIGQFGNRIPNISVELCRVVGDLEPAIAAVTVIPGATEYGYDPTPRVRIVSEGVTANENTHLSQQVSDWTLSLDELQALCPNLAHVALVVDWFGDDLRCGSCTIQPKVEDATRVIDGVEWGVAGLTRGTAGVVSSYGGGAAYGGTPSDDVVTAAIADLSARGIAVTLYPLVLMDVPAGNALPNPYGGTGQPAYPWRGRITCDPAPGVSGSPDATIGVVAQVDAFVGTSGDWGYRRMLLHYAQLAADAGGVDAFLLDSEMRGVSFLRDNMNAFPFVSALVSLAADVRAIVGAGTKLTYGADWSEFTGLQPASAPGDKFFHLDPLWASADIDAVGIDNYMPLADWRDGTDHADAAIADNPFELAYLLGYIAGGEGYDWYYASDADRIAGERTPILDGTYGEPWVWRYKDLVSWWSQVVDLRDTNLRRIVARAIPPDIMPVIASDRPNALAETVPPRALPVFVFAHLPPSTDAPTQSRLLLGAAADPWPGTIVLRDDATHVAIGKITRPANLGALTASLAGGPVNYWDTVNTVTVTLASGHLSSADDDAVLAGTNRIAVLTDSGEWEAIGFAVATLVGPQTYELTRLLRGQLGTDQSIGPAATGNRVVVLDDRLVGVAVASQWLGETVALRAFAGRSDVAGTPLSLTIDAGPALPLSPAHTRAMRAGGTADVTFSWTRRSRGDANSWGISDAPLEVVPEAYRLTVLSGSTPVRVIDTTTTGASYSAAEQTADFGTPPANFTFSVAQLSAQIGPGHPGQGSFHA